MFVLRYGETWVVTELVLLPETGSFGDVSVAIAASVKAPFLVGLMTNVIVAL